jgi:peptidyl-tRNA hydrolase
MTKPELVQPIAVAKAGTHEDVVLAVARASVLAWLDSQECCRWEEWLAGRFTKSVRRGTPAKIDVIASQGYAVCRVALGQAVAVGCVPMTYDEMPEELRKLQVAELERERTGDWGSNIRGPLVSINGAVEMSTGKTAAQVAHGLFAFMLKRSETYRDLWRADDMPIRVEVADELRWKMATAAAVVSITDAGFTEIEPGTSTVVVS